MDRGKKVVGDLIHGNIESQEAQDIGWQYGTRVGKSRQIIKCKFCNREVSGSVTRFKQHLAHQKGNVAACTKVPKKIMLSMRANLQDIKAKKVIKEKQMMATLDACQEEVFGTCQMPNEEEEEEGDEEEMMQARRESLQTAREDEFHRQMFSKSQSVREVGGSNGGIFKGIRHAFSSKKQGEASQKAPIYIHIDEESEFIASRVPLGDEQLFRKADAKQKKLKQMWNKSIIDNLGKAAAKLFLHNSIAPHVADSSYFQVFVDTVAEAGSGIKAPTSYEIDGKYSKEVYKESLDYVQGFRKIWATRGCTLMCDG